MGIYWAYNPFTYFLSTFDPNLLQNTYLLHSLKLTLHLKIYHPKGKLVLQPSIFRCYVSFRGSVTWMSPGSYEHNLIANLWSLTAGGVPLLLRPSSLQAWLVWMEVWPPGPSHHVPWDLADLCQAAGFFRVFFWMSSRAFWRCAMGIWCFCWCIFVYHHLVTCFEGKKKVSMYVFVDIHSLGRGMVYFTYIM